MKRNKKADSTFTEGMTIIKRKKTYSKYKSTRTSRPELATYYPNRKKEDNKQ